MIYQKCLGKTGAPVSGTDVNPEAKVEYDDFGNLTVLECYNGYGSPCLSAFGFHRMENTYTDNNLVASRCYKDTKGKLVAHNQMGYAKVTYSYDEKRNLKKEKHFNHNGTMYNYITYQYNDRDKISVVSYYHANGELDDSKRGFSSIRFTYAKDGVTLTRKTYYKAGGKKVAWQDYDAKKGQWGSLNF